jgi:hypothetical protein
VIPRADVDICGCEPAKVREDKIPALPVILQQIAQGRAEKSNRTLAMSLLKVR